MSDLRGEGGEAKQGPSGKRLPRRRGAAYSPTLPLTLHALSAGGLREGPADGGAAGVKSRKETRRHHPVSSVEAARACPASLPGFGT
jgi:hypothetical protein